MIARKIRRHCISALETASNLVSHPLEMLLLIVMVGVTMSLPITLYAGMYNIERHAGLWGTRPHVTLIMKMEANRAEIESIADQIKDNPLFEETILIDPEEAMNRMSSMQDMQGVIDVLNGENPLPYSLVLVLEHALEDSEITLLQQRLRELTIVDDVLVDVAWMQQLNSSIRVGRVTMLVLAIVLCFGVILVMANAIRAKISERIEEMEILTRMGASRAFVCRPYLYSGLFVGILGALVGTVLVDLLLRSIRQPLAELATQYQSSLTIFTIPALHVLIIALIGGLLGWIAAYLSSQGALNRLALD